MCFMAANTASRRDKANSSEAVVSAALARHHRPCDAVEGVVVVVVVVAVVVVDFVVVGVVVVDAVLLLVIVVVRVAIFC